MKLLFRKYILIIGKFFFWLSLLMLVLVIAESLIFSRLTTITETRSFFAAGGRCYIGGDIGPEVHCDENPLSYTPVEVLLNIPGFYIMQIIILGGYVLWQITTIFGIATADASFDFGVLFAGFILLLLVLSACYYLWKAGIRLMRKLRL